jgi:hypothetical protein
MFPTLFGLPVDFILVRITFEKLFWNYFPFILINFVYTLQLTEQILLLFSPSVHCYSYFFKAHPFK